jgi:hypothetical protein
MELFICGDGWKIPVSDPDQLKALRRIGNSWGPRFWRYRDAMILKFEDLKRINDRESSDPNRMPGSSRIAQLANIYNDLKDQLIQEPTDEVLACRTKKAFDNLMDYAVEENAKLGIVIERPITVF